MYLFSKKKKKKKKKKKIFFLKSVNPIILSLQRQYKSLYYKMYY